MNKTLKYLRRLLAIISIVAVTLLFVDVSTTARNCWGWLAKIQFIPAVLSLNLLVVALLVLITLIFGRIYCSVICPLGIYQDVVNRLRSLVGLPAKKRKNRFGYKAPWTRTRIIILACFIVLLLLGPASIAGLIEPYSAYGRISSQLFAPLYDLVNNRLAEWSVEHDNYRFLPVTIVVVVPVLIVAAVTFIVVTVMAWRGGRDYCNTVCPVGTLLGFLSRFSLLRPMIDTSRCNGCRKCERNCKAKCINGKDHTIDLSRCVVCFDCINNCSTGALVYTWRRGTKDKPDLKSAKPAGEGVSRRSFLITSGMIAGAVAAKAAVEGDGALAAIKEKKAPLRKVPIVPPGSKGLAHLSNHCTGCQLCVKACPNSILMPSTKLGMFMQPHLEYTDAYCRPECVECSQVCPVGAILPIDVAQKSAIKIGMAVVDLDLCISAKGQRCGNCIRHCPANAITMVPRNPENPERNLMPVVNQELCIGCGSCEYNCPVGTAGIIKADQSAIHVEGIEIHREV